MTALPEDVEAIIGEWGAEQSTHHQGVAEIVRRLERRNPRASIDAGEPLLVASWRESHSESELRWRLNVIGEVSGETYAELRFALAGTSVPDAHLEALGLALRLALNDPAHVSDSAWDAFDELAGSS